MWQKISLFTITRTSTQPAPFCNGYFCLVYLIQFSGCYIREEIVVAALRIQKIGITLKLIQFG